MVHASRYALASIALGIVLILMYEVSQTSPQLPDDLLMKSHLGLARTEHPRRRFLQYEDFFDNINVAVCQCKIETHECIMDHYLKVHDYKIDLCLKATHSLGPIKNLTLTHGRATSIDYVEDYVKLGHQQMGEEFDPNNNPIVHSYRDASTEQMTVTLLLPKGRIHLFRRSLVAIVFRRLQVQGHVDMLVRENDDESVRQVDFSVSIPVQSFFRSMIGGWIDTTSPYYYLIVWAIAIGLYIVVRLLLALLLSGYCCCVCRCFAKKKSADNTERTDNVQDEVDPIERDGDDLEKGNGEDMLTERTGVQDMVDPMECGDDLEKGNVWGSI